MIKDSKQSQDNMATQVAIMKYKFNNSQKEIAEKLNISQMSYNFV